MMQYRDLMTEAELIDYLRVPEISNAGDEHPHHRAVLWRPYASLDDLAAILEIKREHGLRLDVVHPKMRQAAIEAYGRGDIGRFLCLADSHLNMRLFFDNEAALMDRGVYEEALAEALTATSTNNRRHSLIELECACKQADRGRLLNAGDPLPSGEAFTVYRGISGKGRYRRIRGPSWTGSLPVACWFALRYSDYGIPDPAVYEATIRREDVFFYCNGRNEQEFVCWPKKYRRLPMSVDQMRVLAESHKKTAKESHAAGIVG